MRLVKSDTVFSTFYGALVNYPAPSNLTYMWNFGFYAGFCLIIQIVTGIFLAMHYAAESTMAMSSIEHIMRDVNYGWLLRYVHANGASMFFIVVYIHIFRGLYYGSYLTPRKPLWLVGVAILFLMIMTAFLGYVLPWGQMSFWGATVITNLVSAVPVIGSDIVIWLWGGYSVDNATLNRFFSFHYVLPFIILALVGLHIVYLHDHGSNNPIGVAYRPDYIPFYPYYVSKDFFGILVFSLFFSIFVFFAPNLLSHPDNYIPANPLVTPTHIVPEWYFLPFYAVLRSIPDKLGGVVAMMLSILALAFLPFLAPSEVRSLNFRPIGKFLFYFLVAFSVLLGWLGSQPAEAPYIEVARLVTALYFSYFFIFMPIEVFVGYFFWTNSHYLSKFKQVNSN